MRRYAVQNVSGTGFGRCVDAQDIQNKQATRGLSCVLDIASRDGCGRDTDLRDQTAEPHRLGSIFD